MGRVSRVGAAVKGFAAGDLAGVGFMVDSCGTCPECHEGLEQHCQSGAILTYNSPDKHLGGMTYGGYSKRIVSLARSTSSSTRFPPRTISTRSRRS